ncbi:capsid cement protein [Phaeobacter sp. 11ANDIMAR09]|uniref:capsid cement protein n=1 Tax=Phaeobacter sp. 11ANDIMAR09 TaxID=1225647 RepID=UPI0006C8C53C|nr:capsid cement protein [Phaeobacter sp. 11ANDIMAR09]KPD10870.1 hypothetical protein AN476_18625 [Phaeobacter sp. 11ANDIMAR09]
MIPSFTRAYEAAAAIEGYRIVVFADPANGSTITTASDNTSASLGIADSMGAELGGMCDVHRDGLYPVRLGGPVAAGDPLTSDANGAAIKAVAAAGTTIRIIGFAEEPGVADDLCPTFLSPGLLHEA